jgi:predicted RNase H-like HicB family nuclease
VSTAGSRRKQPASAGPAKLKLRIVIHREEGEGYWAEVPGFPGCLTSGATLDEVRANVREAFAGVLASMQAHGWSEQHPGDAAEEIEL